MYYCFHMFLSYVKVPRDLVNEVMYEHDPDGLEERQLCNKGKRRKLRMSFRVSIGSGV